MLLAILPHTFKFLSIRVVHDSRASTVIVLKFTFIHLTIGPEVRAFAYFLTLVECAIKETSIRPLEQAFSVHCIIQEGPLVHFSPRRDAPTESIDLAFLKVALKDGIARIDFKAHTIRLGRVIAKLATELGPTSSLIKLHLHRALCIHIVIKIVMLVVIKRPKHLIDVSDRFIADFCHDIVIVAESEIMTQLDNVSIQSFTHINHDVFFSPQLVFHDNLSRRQVNVEIIETLFQDGHVIIQLILIVEELYKGKGAQFVDKRLCSTFKHVDFAPHFIFLTKHVVTQIVQCVVEHLKD